MYYNFEDVLAAFLPPPYLSLIVNHLGLTPVGSACGNAEILANTITKCKEIILFLNFSIIIQFSQTRTNQVFSHYFFPVAILLETLFLVNWKKLV